MHADDRWARPDYRGKNGERAIWKFDAPLVSQINDVLKQAAIEEGQWAEKRDSDQDASLQVTIGILNEGRDRVAKAKLERDAIEARIRAADPARSTATSPEGPAGAARDGRSGN